MGKWTTPALLLASNGFMTFAWYGHLKQRDRGLVYAVLVSWGIAFFEYCLMVQANRFGYGAFSGFQLKIMQEVITLTVFIVFAKMYLGESLRWNYAVALILIFAAVLFAFWDGQA
jgi:uncharacterized protein (DUF486 family)